MFDYWSREARIGNESTLVLVARQASDLEMPAVTSQLTALSPIVEYRATTHGKPSGRYFYRVAKGYSSPR